MNVQLRPTLPVDAEAVYMTMHNDHAQSDCEGIPFKSCLATKKLNTDFLMKG